MTFIQIIDYETDRFSEIEVLLDEWRDSSEGRRYALSSVTTKDRDRDGRYLTIVEFPDYATAMANSSLPETTAFAERMLALCTAAPTFLNLDEVRREKI